MPGKIGHRRKIRGPQARPRVCLVCGEEFPSEGPWNRICPDCDKGRDSMPPRAVPKRCLL